MASRALRKERINTFMTTNSSNARFATGRSPTSTCYKPTSGRTLERNRFSAKFAKNASAAVTISKFTCGCTQERSRK